MKQYHTNCETEQSGSMAIVADNDNFPSTRDEARKHGVNKFMTGVACLRGHIAPRYTVNGACTKCTFDSKQRRKDADPEAWKEIARLERQRAFEKDPERVRRHTREFMRKWRAANQDLSNEIMRIWRLENPESARSHSAKNRAKRKSAEGTYTKSDVIRLLLLQGRKCAECKKNLSNKYHVDHIMPLARGGSNWPTNLQILCQPCNQSKHARDPLEWARSKGRLL